MAYDLLGDDVVEAAEDGASMRVTLPGLFAAWGCGHDLELDGVRRHQRAAMHMFLCQVAAAAWMRDPDNDKLAVGEGAWRERLLRLAPAPAWHLLQEDDAVPAFLQAPVRSGESKEFKVKPSPDLLTILVLSKNHLVKQGQVGRATPWQWAAALVELQTMCGFGGAKNYGIIRMNGGQASRPLVAVYPDMRSFSRWSRDIAAIRARAEWMREKLPADFYAPEGEGLVASWVRPWDGEGQLHTRELDPLFVEVARRVRLSGGEDSRIMALVGNSSAPRVAVAKEQCGRAGDPWAPLDGPGKVLTVPSEGWSLRRLKGLIAPDAKTAYLPSLLQQLRPGEKGDMYFHASVVTGGQGKTEGFHEVTIPVPGRVVTRLTASLAAEGPRLGAVATAMLEDGEAVARILRRATLCFVQGGPLPREIKGDRKEAEPTVAAFAAAYWDRYFEELWDAFDAGGDLTQWRDALRQMAEAAYDEATRTLPVRGEVFYRAQTRGRGVLVGAMNAAFNLDKGADGAEEAA